MINIAERAEVSTLNLSARDFALFEWSCTIGGVLLSRLLPGLRRIDARVLAAISLGLVVTPVLTALRTKTPAP